MTTTRRNTPRRRPPRKVEPKADPVAVEARDVEPEPEAEGRRRV
jgi:hypothetical protein